MSVGESFSSCFFQVQPTLDIGDANVVLQTDVEGPGSTLRVLVSIGRTYDQFTLRSGKLSSIFVNHLIARHQLLFRRKRHKIDAMWPEDHTRGSRPAS